MSYYLPRIYVNGVKLTGLKIHEVRNAGGAFVDEVHIEAPDFEIQKKGEGE